MGLALVSSKFNVLMSDCDCVIVESTFRLLLHPCIDVDPGFLWVALKVHRLQLSLIVL